MTDWNKVADYLDNLTDSYPDKTGNIEQAITLCRREAATVESSMTDWNKVASCIEHDTTHSSDENEEALRAAITLCRRMAKGELVERSKAHDILDAAQQMSEEDMAAFANDVVEGKYDFVMPLSIPPAATQDERELAECRQYARELGFADEDLRCEMVLRMRQSARAEGERAGFDRGLAAGEAVRTLLLNREKNAEDAQAECEAKLIAVCGELDELQSKLERLATAAHRAADTYGSASTVHDALEELRKVLSEVAPETGGESESGV